METKQEIKEPEKIMKTQGLDEDEEMIIEASEDLEVVKTFEELGLREELLRGKIIDKVNGFRHIRLWVQQTISCSAKSHSTNY